MTTEDRLRAALKLAEDLEREVYLIRWERWHREWAGGKHRDAPPEPGLGEFLDDIRAAS